MAMVNAEEPVAGGGVCSPESRRSGSTPPVCELHPSSVHHSEPSAASTSQLSPSSKYGVALRSALPCIAPAAPQNRHSTYGRSNTVRIHRSLRIHLIEAKNLPAKKYLYHCELWLDEAFYSKSAAKPVTSSDQRASPNPNPEASELVFWGQIFDFDDLQEVHYVFIHLFRTPIAEKKRSKQKPPQKIYVVTIPVGRIARSCLLVEDWFTAVAVRSPSARRSAPSVQQQQQQLVPSSARSSCLQMQQQEASKSLRCSTLQAAASTYSVDSTVSASALQQPSAAASASASTHSRHGLFSSLSLSFGFGLGLWGKRKSDGSSARPHQSPSSASVSQLGAAASSKPCVRVRARFRTLEILPLANYDPLIKLVRSEYLSLIELLESHVQVKHKETLAGALVNIMYYLNRVQEFLVDIILQEIYQSHDIATAFRGNSVATKSIEAFQKHVGDCFLNDVLSKPVRDLLASDDDCEVNPANLLTAGPKTLERNRAALVRWCSTFWNSIYSRARHLPGELRGVFSELRARMQAAGRTEHVDYVISSSLFLRLLCPAILSPSLFGLVAEYPSERSARNLTLIAKAIQNLANFTPLGKEAYMTFMNQQFLDLHWDHMKTLLYQISSPPSSSASSASCSPTRSSNESDSAADGGLGVGVGDGSCFVDLGREAALLHTLFIELLAPDSDCFHGINEKQREYLERLQEVVHPLSGALDTYHSTGECPPAAADRSEFEVATDSAFSDSRDGTLLPQRATDSNNLRSTISCSAIALDVSAFDELPLATASNTLNRGSLSNPKQRPDCCFTGRAPIAVLTEAFSSTLSSAISDDSLFQKPVDSSLERRRLFRANAAAASATPASCSTQRAAPLPVPAAALSFAPQQAFPMSAPSRSYFQQPLQQQPLEQQQPYFNFREPLSQRRDQLPEQQPQQLAASAQQREQRQEEQPLVSDESVHWDQLHLRNKLQRCSVSLASDSPNGDSCAVSSSQNSTGPMQLQHTWSVRQFPQQDPPKSPLVVSRSLCNLQADQHMDESIEPVPSSMDSSSDGTSTPLSGASTASATRDTIVQVQNAGPAKCIMPPPLVSTSVMWQRHQQQQQQQQAAHVLPAAFTRAAALPLMPSGSTNPNAASSSFPIPEGVTVTSNWLHGCHSSESVLPLAGAPRLPNAHQLAAADLTHPLQCRPLIPPSSPHDPTQYGPLDDAPVRAHNSSALELEEEARTSAETLRGSQLDGAFEAERPAATGIAVGGGVCCDGQLGAAMPSATCVLCGAQLVPLRLQALAPLCDRCAHSHARSAGAPAAAIVQQAPPSLSPPPPLAEPFQMPTICTFSAI